MSKSTKSILFLIIIPLSLLFLAGCNTMKGAGEDLEAAGNKMQEKAS